MKTAPELLIVLGFLGKNNLTAGSLLAYGGEDLRSRHGPTAQKAKRVERCWELLARHRVRPKQIEEIAPPGSNLTRILKALQNQ